MACVGRYGMCGVACVVWYVSGGVSGGVVCVGRCVCAHRGAAGALDGCAHGGARGALDGCAHCGALDGCAHRGAH